ncbi:MAG TPA: hypothetical protein VGT44_13775 [Ktedonobacteraceae bacterium]|nr:hypothetical protein [Ktedonobacteraceae bacterium]
MMIALLVVIVLVSLLDLGALRWGVSSVDGADSPEWERRHLWYGFH